MNPARPALRLLLLPAVFLPLGAFAADPVAVAPASNLPEVGGSIARMLGGLAFVFALFFGGLWLFKNWQRVIRRHHPQRLNILEARSLGPRQALYVVGYDAQKFLVAASTGGVTLISALPSEEPAATPAAEGQPASQGALPFTQLLQQALGRK